MGNQPSPFTYLICEIIFFFFKKSPKNEGNEKSWLSSLPFLWATLYFHIVPYEAAYSPFLLRKKGIDCYAFVSCSLVCLSMI